LIEVSPAEGSWLGGSILILEAILTRRLVEPLPPR
jgi:hypothetical protein